VLLKIVPKAGHESTQEKIDQIELVEKFDAAYGTIFRASKCLKKK
jgi:hypothetical protein